MLRWKEEIWPPMNADKRRLRAASLPYRRSSAFIGGQ
jgi:hypothetical protein